MYRAGPPLTIFACTIPTEGAPHNAMFVVLVTARILNLVIPTLALPDLDVSTQSKNRLEWATPRLSLVEKTPESA